MRAPLKTAFGKSRVVGFLNRHVSQGAVVLSYHGLVEEYVNRRVQEPISIPLSAFERHIHYLRSNFDIVSLGELADCVSRDFKISGRPVVLTFDDGYRSVLTMALPLLRQYSIPFAVFVSTHHVSTGARFPTYVLRVALYCSRRPTLEVPSINQSYDISSEDRRRATHAALSAIMKSKPRREVDAIVDDLRKALSEGEWTEWNERFHSDAVLDWDEVAHLAAAGVTIGSHCHDHALLNARQPEEEVERQLSVSRQLIEARLGRCEYFAYPNGTREDVTRAGYRQVHHAGYRLGFTTIRGEVKKGTLPLALPRICAQRASLEDFRFIFNASKICHAVEYRPWRKAFSATGSLGAEAAA